MYSISCTRTSCKRAGVRVDGPLLHCALRCVWHDIPSCDESAIAAEKVQQCEHRRGQCHELLGFDRNAALQAVSSGDGSSLGQEPCPCVGVAGAHDDRPV